MLRNVCARPSLPLLLAALLPLCSGFNFLDFLNTGRAGIPALPPLGPESILSYARQGLHLLSFLKQMKENKARTQANSYETTAEPDPDQRDFSLWKHDNNRRFQDMPLYSKVPNVAKAVDDLPGFGACLPKGTPLFSPMSQSFMQNLLRTMPGIYQKVREMQSLPSINPKKLMGKWYWVITTSGSTTKHCAMSSFYGLARSVNGTASFAVLDSFRDGSEYAIPKLGFGYGLVKNSKASIYEQSDPCPYDVVMVSEDYNYDDDQQYDYIVLSNWAHYPVIVLAKNVDDFFENQYAYLKNDLRKVGLEGVLSQLLHSSQPADWAPCNAKRTLGNLASELLEKLIQSQRA